MSEEERTPTAMTMPRYEEYVGTIRALWAAFNNGDYEGALALAHPEVEMQDYPGLPDAEWHHGRDGATRWAVKLHESSSDIQIEPSEFIPITEDMLVVITAVTATGRRSGVPFLATTIAALVGMRDGLCARMALYTSKADALRGAAEALEAAGLSE